MAVLADGLAIHAAPHRPCGVPAFDHADVEFAQMMISRHAQAVEMARMVPDDGVSPERVVLATAVAKAEDELAKRFQRRALGRAHGERW